MRRCGPAGCTLVAVGAVGCWGCACTHTGCSHDANYQSLCFRAGTGVGSVGASRAHDPARRGRGGSNTSPPPRLVIIPILGVLDQGTIIASHGE